MNAQIEIPTFDIVLIEESDDVQHIIFDVENNFDSDIDLDWEVEYSENVMSFLTISVSDINIEYAPQILTSCDLNGIENILGASEAHPMSLHFNLEEVPTAFDRDANLAYFHLYKAGACSMDTLSTLPIKLNNGIVNLIDLGEAPTIKLYPNPSSHTLHFEMEDHSKPAPYKILDFQARCIMSGNLSNQTIDVSNLAPGKYIFKTYTQSIVFTIK